MGRTKSMTPTAGKKSKSKPKGYLVTVVSLGMTPKQDGYGDRPVPRVRTDIYPAKSITAAFRAARGARPVVSQELGYMDDGVDAAGHPSPCALAGVFEEEEGAASRSNIDEIDKFDIVGACTYYTD